MPKGPRKAHATALRPARLDASGRLQEVPGAWIYKEGSAVDPAEPSRPPPNRGGVRFAVCGGPQSPLAHALGLEVNLVPKQIARVPKIGAAARRGLRPFRS